MTQTAATDIKVKHRQMWASGDYPRLAEEVIPSMGRTLVEACSIGRDERVLDVAAGSGNAAIPAALAGADVVATDLTPELLDAGKALADARGATLTWETADAEALPYAEGEFDTAVSCVGVMFAPHHQASADELARVVRPGGTIGLASWTPQGYIGQLFATMRPFAPAPPPGAQPPPLWGDEDHVRSLFGDRLTDVEARRELLTVDRFSTPAEFREFFKSYYGPTIAVYRSLAEQPDRAAELDAAIDDLAAGHDVESGRMEWEYLLFVARRTP